MRDIRTKEYAMRLVAFLSLGAALALPASISAQWPTWPTAGVPRNADGTPNLNAPPPRTADGHIDFSGIWESRAFCFGGQGNTPRGTDGAGGDGRPRSTAAVGTETPLAQCFNVGAGLAGGAPLQSWATDLRRRRIEQNLTGNPQSHCLPMGHLQLWLNPQPHQILQTPRELLLIFEANSGLRHVFTDGRPSPTNDPQPWWYGYTVGQWNGDTLVATTTHLKDGMWLDLSGTPLTDAATITERLRRPTFGTIEIDITVDDPKAFTKPFTVRVNQYLMLDTDLMEFICNENEHSSPHYVE
jgi:hypothetical protein